MTLTELRNMVMFQTNNDVEDLGEFQPAVDGYINEGYDRLVEAYDENHTDPDSDDYPRLEKGNDVPNLPEWCHRAIADYATYLVYRNGNVTKQNRSVPYYQLFMDVLNKVMEAKRKASGNKLHFHGLYD